MKPSQWPTHGLLVEPSAIIAHSLSRRSVSALMHALHPLRPNSIVREFFLVNTGIVLVMVTSYVISGARPNA